jgi:hypothetical protein
MSQHILKKSALDLGALESEIQRRLQRGKTKLFISEFLCFLVAVIFIFFVI